MKDGTILLHKMDYDVVKNMKFSLEKISALAIMEVTDSTLVHASLVLNEKTYDATIYTRGKFLQGYFSLFSGVRTSNYILGHTIALEPTTPMTHNEKEKMQAYINEMINEKRPYNILRLLSLAIVHPTRKFWNWIGWVPFKKEVYGEVCSTFIDKAWEAAGRDILPRAEEELTAPGDFLKLLEYGTFKQV